MVQERSGALRRERDMNRRWFLGLLLAPLAALLPRRAERPDFLYLSFDKAGTGQPPVKVSREFVKSCTEVDLPTTFHTIDYVYEGKPYRVTAVEIIPAGAEILSINFDTRALWV